MERKIIDYMVNYQIENVKYDLKLLNIQLEFYSKLLENVKIKHEKEKYQKKIDDINKMIEININDINSLNN